MNSDKNVISSPGLHSLSLYAHYFVCVFVCVFWGREGKQQQNMKCHQGEKIMMFLMYEVC